MKALFLSLFFIKNLISFAQTTPQKQIDLSFLQQNDDISFYKNKTIDTTFQQQIKIALLFYPELKNAYITFKVKKSKSPLSARPSMWAAFQKPKNRRYIVVISTKTIDRLEPILLKNLSFNAQIGVLGHELSHVADFHQRKGIYFFKLLAMQLNRKAMDTFENDTDRRCIEHGLGYRLLAWSTEVRQNLKIKQWHGANTEGVLEKERYMSPQTIERIMGKLALYK
jgi:Zn-dependent protease with chaperone function